MPRNAHDQNDLYDNAPAGEADEAGPPPFGFTPLGPDPSLGWSGVGAGTLEPWAHAQAERLLREDEGDEGDRPRREPREP
ncbi:MAG TPA: hypothetical protein VEX86_22220 [Longimicrobium sp.]|nr:hypothetical protein [Longimicrobium sp.]